MELMMSMSIFISTFMSSIFNFYIILFYTLSIFINLGVE